MTDFINGKVTYDSEGQWLAEAINEKITKEQINKI